MSVTLASTGEFFVPSAFLGASLCAVEPHEVTCTIPAELVPVLFGAKAYTYIEGYIKVKVEGAKSDEETDASVSGGGAPSVSVQRPIVVDGEATRFGVEQYELRPENADGSPDTQAGSHPFQLASVIALNRPQKRSDRRRR